MTLDNLSNNDRTKWDFFLSKMTLIEFFNELAYRKEKDAVEAERLRQQTKG